MNNGTVSNGTVYAAGGILWRLSGGKLRVLVVHRKAHDDVSFPKGKVKPGEILAETAAREVREETGIRAAIGPPIGICRYRLPGGRKKVVHYWAMRAKERAVRESTFTPNREIDAVEWLPAEVALKRLSYAFDVEILETFLAQFDNGARATFPIVAQRHGTAMSRSDWGRADRLRPLTDKGAAQARSLARELRAFGVRKIVSSTATRCVETVAPLSAALKRPIAASDDISQDAWEDGLDDIASIVDKRVDAGKGAVICSHGPVLPGILERIAVATHESSGARFTEHAGLRTGSFVVAHVSKHEPERRLVAVESHAPIV